MPFFSTNGIDNSQRETIYVKVAHLEYFIFLLNQELQIIPLEFALVGIGGPGFGESQFSMRSLLIALACTTGTTWAIGMYFAFRLARPPRC